MHSTCNKHDLQRPKEEIPIESGTRKDRPTWPAGPWCTKTRLKHADEHGSGFKY